MFKALASSMMLLPITYCGQGIRVKLISAKDSFHISGNEECVY
tara:strand:- start:1894 stop:2022 length:129 start_codon:yes stop_codon:yes gene_type:complete